MLRTNAGDFYAKASAAFEKGHYDQAERYFIEALTLKPRSAELWASLACTQFRLLKYDDAETSCLKAIRLSPKTASYYNNLSVYQGEQRKHSEAAASLKEAVRLAPSTVLYWQQLCVMQHKLNNHADSRYSRVKAFILEPNNKKTWDLIYRMGHIDPASKEAVDFKKSMDEDQVNATTAMKNLDERVGVYHYFGDDVVHCKAEASYYIVNTFHKQQVSQEQIDLYRKKLNAPSRNLGSKTAFHDAIKHYYAESIRAGHAVSDIYVTTDDLVQKSACLFSSQSLEATCYKALIDNHINLNTPPIGKDQRETAARLVLNLKLT